MTMSVHQRRDISDLSESKVTSLPVKTTKRSFDVAFLISQDDKSKQKRKVVLSGLNYQSESSNDEACLVSRPSSVEKFPKCPIYDESQRSPTCSRFVQSSPPIKQVFDDPRGQVIEQKSAFTKVKLDNGIISPGQSISPELTYQNSLSPSPPAFNTYVPKSFQNLLPSNAFKNLPAYQNAFMEHSQPRENPMFKTLEQQVIFKSHQPVDVFSPKMRHSMLHYRPDLNPYAGYPSFIQAPPSELVKFQPQHPQQDIIKLQTNPAAAILNSLLPPTFAALSLPAQNVCAKCNISFRMTSDLVYHMRSHHKSEMANDSFKKRREDKLKCPVCSESFRERHHLTRHMTAHQDKEGDGIEEVLTSGQQPNGRKIRNMNPDPYSNNVFCK